MIWVLMMWLGSPSPNGVSMVAEFNTSEACQKAYDFWRDETHGQYSGGCFEKGYMVPKK